MFCSGQLLSTGRALVTTRFASDPGCSRALGSGLRQVLNRDGRDSAAAAEVLAKFVHLVVDRAGARGSSARGGGSPTAAEYSAGRLSMAAKLFEYLDGPVRRVCGKDSFVAYAPVLEDEILPQVDDVLAAIVDLHAY